MTLIVTDGQYIYEDRQATSNRTSKQATTKLIKLSDNLIMAHTGNGLFPGSINLAKSCIRFLTDATAGEQLDTTANYICDHLRTLYSPVENGDYTNSSLMFINPTQVIKIYGANLMNREIHTRSIANPTICAIGSGVGLFTSLYDGRDVETAFVKAVIMSSSCGHGINKINLRNLGKGV